MIATITFSLTPDTQRVLIASTGGPVKQTHTAPLDITADEIHFFKISADGDLSAELNQLKAGYTCKNWFATSVDSREAFDEYKAALIVFLAEYTLNASARLASESLRNTERLARDAAELALVDAAIAAFLANPALRSACDTGNQIPGKWVPYGHPRYAEVCADAKRRDALDAAERRAFISSWIAAHAPLLIQQQDADGLLCDGTALTLITDAAFGSPDSPACTDRSCGCTETDITCLPRRVYPAWRELKAKLPANISTTFHRRNNDCEHGTVRYAVTVTIHFGPLTLTRRLALDAKVRNDAPEK